MNEVGDFASQVPALVLVALWWALLSMLDLLSGQYGASDGEGSGDHLSGKIQGLAGGRDLAELYKTDPDFDADAFLRNACRAYEEILRAYALCDMKALRTLLSDDVFRAFEQASARRMEKGETLELTLVGISSATIADVVLDGQAVEISVLFRAEIIQAERGPAGDVTCGDPTVLADVADLWTFSRFLPIGSGSWTLVATGEPA